MYLMLTFNMQASGFWLFDKFQLSLGHLLQVDYVVRPTSLSIAVSPMPPIINAVQAYKVRSSIHYFLPQRFMPEDILDPRGQKIGSQESRHQSSVPHPCRC